MPPEELRLRLTHHERDSDKFTPSAPCWTTFLSWPTTTSPGDAELSMTRREKLEHRAATHCRECLASFETADFTFCCATVVRKGSLYYPINFRFLAKKRSKTAKFRPKILCHQRCHRFVTAPFLEQKALKTANSEKCVFRVLRQMCCLGLQIRSFSAENRLQVALGVRRAPKSVF